MGWLEFKSARLYEGLGMSCLSALLVACGLDVVTYGQTGAHSLSSVFPRIICLLSLPDYRPLDFSLRCRLRYR